MTKDKRLIFISYSLLIVIIVISVLIWKRYTIDKLRGVKPVSEIVSEQFKQKEKEISGGLIPSRPEDYGMEVISNFDKPETQAEWNEFLGKKISGVKSRFTGEELDKIRDKIKEDPKKTQEKLIKIDQGIEECQAALEEDSGNKEIQRKLERLMILKALAEGFKDF